jgi:N-acyl-D-aspartate/D-glutamate deacylase
MECNEGRGRPGAPTKEQRESKEHQPLPNVWDVLERKVRINEERSSSRITEEEHDQERQKLDSSLNELDEKGTARDRVIEELYNVLTIELTNSFSIKIKALSLDEFHQLRSKVEPMSDDEIREEIREKREERKRQREEFHKSNSGHNPFVGLAKH